MNLSTVKYYFEFNKNGIDIDAKEEIGTIPERKVSKFEDYIEVLKRYGANIFPDGIVANYSASLDIPWRTISGCFFADKKCNLILCEH